MGENIDPEGKSCIRCRHVGRTIGKKYPKYKKDGKLYKCSHCGHFISTPTYSFLKDKDLVD